MDDLLAGTGAAYRALACPSFFENLLEEAASIRDKGVFADAADADRKAPMVAVADIAAAAARLLLDRSWTGTGSVPVLGPRDLSPNDLARIMTDRLGRPVRYERRQLDDLRADLLGYGLDEAFVQGIVDMKRAKNEGLDAGVTRTPDTTGPTTLVAGERPPLLPGRCRGPPGEQDRARLRLVRIQQLLRLHGEARLAEPAGNAGRLAVMHIRLQGLVAVDRLDL
jgi:hypothetical protein